jgi:two-component system, NarL family, sensor kinase
VNTSAHVPAPPSPARAVAVFLAAGLLVLTAVGVVLAMVQHHQAEDEAIRDARMLTETQASFLVPFLGDEALVPGDDQDVLDRVIRRRVLGERIVEVRIWREDGTIVYSDDTDLIGQQFELSTDELSLFIDGTEPVAEVSDLDEDENASQSDFDRLMQVYVAVENLDGTPLLYETYQSYEIIAEASRERTLAFLPVLVGGLALLWLAQAPLAWQLASRLRAAHDEREQLLVAALAASDRERQRIAADLHDGVVQGLSGASYTLTAEAARLSQGGDARSGEVLHRMAVDLRRSVRELRSLIVTITPPGLRRQPMLASLKDLVAPLEDRGLAVDVLVEDDDLVDEAVVDLVLRTAQEAVRNILRHAGADRATVRFRADDALVELQISDDGGGFSPGPHAGRRDSLGLDLLAGLAQQHGGTLEVHSTPGAGTRLDLRVPRRVPEPVPA